MKTVYLNWKGPQGIETVDEFTQGVDAPSKFAEFRKYVSEMVSEHWATGMNVYKSRRPCKEWEKKGRKRT